MATRQPAGTLERARRNSAAARAKELLKVYARKGETVTCTNGHPIFRFKRHVRFGQVPVDEDTCAWTQKKLKIGDPITNCATCGAKYAVNHSRFGFLCFIDGQWRISETELATFLASQAKPGEVL